MLKKGGGKMGLINEVNNISQEIKTQNTEKEQKRIEKIKKEYQEKEKKRIEQQTSDFLKTEFEEHFKEFGSTYETEFLSIDRKNKILENCKKDILRAYNDPKFPLKEYYKDTDTKILFEHFNKNYYKLLKEQKTIYLNNEKYIFNKQLKEATQHQEQQPTKKETFQRINKAAGQAIGIGILAAAGGMGLLLGAAIKGSNKKRRF